MLYKSGILILPIFILLMIIKPKLIIIVKQYPLPEYVFCDISDSFVTRNIAKLMFNARHTTKEKIRCAFHTLGNNTYNQLNNLNQSIKEIRRTGKTV